MSKFTVVLGKIEWLHGTIGMFMFILQESAQTLGMAAFIAIRNDRLDLAKKLATHAITEICDPAIDFTNDFGWAAYPLHMAYREFFLAAKRNFQTYLEM